MRTGEYVYEQLKKMKELDIYGTKKELKELPNLLGDSEELIYVTSGLFNGNTWLIALTNCRILFLDKGMFYGLKTKNVSLDMVNSLEFKGGLMLGNLSIWTGGDQIEIKSIKKKGGRIFEQLTLEQLKIHKKNLYTSKTNNFTENNDIGSKEDLVDKLVRLSKLKDDGILTEEEFAKAKEKFLA